MSNESILSYWDLFMDTCYGPEKTALERAIGDRYFRSGDRVYVLSGKPRSGKTTALYLIYNIFKTDPFVDVRFEWPMSKLNELLGRPMFTFCETNETSENVPENVVVIHTTGNIIPLDEYKKMMRVLSDLNSLEVIIQYCMSRAYDYILEVP